MRKFNWEPSWIAMQEQNHRKMNATFLIVLQVVNAFISKGRPSLLSSWMPGKTRPRMLEAAIGYRGPE